LKTDTLFIYCGAVVELYTSSMFVSLHSLATSWLSVSWCRS